MSYDRTRKASFIYSAIAEIDHTELLIEHRMKTLPLAFRPNSTARAKNLFSRLS